MLSISIYLYFSLCISLYMCEPVTDGCAMCKMSVQRCHHVYTFIHHSNVIKSVEKCTKNHIRCWFDVSMESSTYSCHFTSHRARDRAQNCCLSFAHTHFPLGNYANDAFTIPINAERCFSVRWKNTVEIPLAQRFMPTIIICNFFLYNFDLNAHAFSRLI